MRYVTSKECAVFLANTAELKYAHEDVPLQSLHLQKSPIYLTDPVVTQNISHCLQSLHVASK